mgnify:CR=1 FL=1
MFLIGWKKHGWLLYGFTKEKPKKIFIEREINVIFMSLYYTFTKGVAEKRFVGFENFVDLAGNTAFQLSVRNSLAFIAVGVPVIVVISLAFSIMMSDRLYRFPRWAMLSPIIVPVASALMGWSVVFGNRGLVNSILNLLGMDAVEFFGIKYARAVMIFIFIIKNTGYMSVIFTGALSSISREYKEAFFLDSKSEIKYACKIVIPLIAPIIFFVVILCTVNSFQMFREVYAMYGNAPPLNVYLLQNFMNNNFFKLNYQRLSTAAFIVIMCISIVVASFLKFQKKHSA